MKDSYRETYKKGREITYIPDTEHNRSNPRKGRRLDRIMLSQDLIDNNKTVINRRDTVYTQTYKMEHTFDHGSVILTFNEEANDIGPGSFKLDPHLIESGCLDNIVKLMIMEAQIYTTEIPEIINAYEERNAKVDPITKRLTEIQKNREGRLYKNKTEEENVLIKTLNDLNSTLPTIVQMDQLNKNKAHIVLTLIQNKVITEIKAKQVTIKKEAKNALKNITTTLDKLNRINPETRTEDENRELESEKRKYEQKYTDFFKQECEKDSIFRSLNLEKPTKWFLNLSKSKKQSESPSQKIINPKTGKKFVEKKELQALVHEHFTNIFEFKHQKTTKIEDFLGDIADKEETLKKKLTIAEKEENEKDITLDELEYSLKTSNGGKTHGIDGIEKNFLTRFWPLLKKHDKKLNRLFL